MQYYVIHVNTHISIIVYNSLNYSLSCSFVGFMKRIKVVYVACHELVCCGHSLKAVVDTHWKDLNLKNCKKFVGPDLNPNC